MICLRGDEKLTGPRAAQAKEEKCEAGGWAGHLSQSWEIRKAGMATVEPVPHLEPAPGASGTWSSQQPREGI